MHKKITDTLHLLELPNWVHTNEGVITTTFIRNLDDFMTLVNYCLEQGIDKLSEVPIADEIVKEIQKIDSVKLSNNIDSDEYIYDTLDLVSLEGKHYADFRSKINRFNRLYPEHKFIKSNKKPDGQTYKAIKALYEVWHDLDTQSSKDSSNEDLALQKYIESGDTFINTSNNYYLYLKNKLVAYAMVEIVNGSCAVGHFLKINLNLTGANEYFIHKICESLNEESVKYLNAQEDMGVLGLRDYKQRLRPTKMIRAYDISLG